MKRVGQTAILVAAAFLLYLYTQPSYTHRFRLTIEVETPDGIKTGFDQFLNFRILFDAQVETGILRFGPAPLEGRIAIVTDVGCGIRAARSRICVSASLRGAKATKQSTLS